MAAEPIDLTAGPTQAVNAHAEGHECTCGEHDDGAIVLDARPIPHAIRHATIFGALDTIAPGFSLDLIAPHNPLPLLSQIEQRWPGAFATSYLQEGPEAWTIRFTRTA